MYNSVAELFKEMAPDLLSALEESGGFWPKIKDNSISNNELSFNASFGPTASFARRAAKILLEAREKGKIASPK